MRYTDHEDMLIQSLKQCESTVDILELIKSETDIYSEIYRSILSAILSQNILADSQGNPVFCDIEYLNILRIHTLEQDCKHTISVFSMQINARDIYLCKYECQAHENPDLGTSTLVLLSRKDVIADSVFAQINIDAFRSGVQKN